MVKKLLVLFTIVNMFTALVSADELQMRVTEAENDIKTSATTDIDYKKGMLIDTDTVDSLVKSAVNVKQKYDNSEEASRKDLKTDVVINLKGCRSKAVINLSTNLKDYSGFVDNIIINANDIYCFVKPSEFADNTTDENIELNIEDSSKIVSKYNGTGLIFKLKIIVSAVFLLIGLHMIVLNLFGIKRLNLTNLKNINIIRIIMSVVAVISIILALTVLLIDWYPLAEKKILTVDDSSDKYFEINSDNSSTADKYNGIYIGIPLFSDTFNENITAVFRQSSEELTGDTVVGGKYIDEMDILQFPVTRGGKYYLKNNNVNYDDITGSDTGLNEAVSALAAKNIFTGKTDNIFAPDELVTRADVAIILCKIFDVGFVYNSDVEYSDITSSDWYYDYAIAAKEKGLFNGYEDGTFRGSNTMTREEFCAALGQVMVNKLGYKLDNDTTVLNSYSDKQEISQWALGYVALLENENVKIWSEKYSPKQPITRGEAAMLAYRIYMLAN